MISALVTGSDGFIGRNIVKKLRKMDVCLVCVDKDPKYLGTIKLDVASRKFPGYFQHKKFDFILHFGSPCSILQFNKDPFYCMENTIVGFWNILRIAENCNAQVIYPSSGNVYGSQEFSHCETDIPIPSNIYGRSKLRCEKLADYFDVNSIGLRIYCSYGAGEEMKGYLASVLCLFLIRMMKGDAPIIWGDGSQVRDFVHIDDVVDAVLRCLTLSVSAKINVASGYSCSYDDLVKLINKILNTDIVPQYVDKPSHYNYVDKTFANIYYLRNILNIEPRSLEDGLRQFHKYLSRIRI